MLEALDETVLWISSVDLAHTHLASGPYGYSPAAEPFDLAAGGWARSGDFKLLNDAAALADAALSCGISQMIIQHGIMVCCEAERCRRLS